MRFREVFTNKVAWALGHILLFANNSNSTPTAGCRWFHNIHVLVTAGLSFLIPPFVVFRKQISWWTNLEVLTMSPPLSLGISPEIALMSDVPGTCKVVQLLILVHVLQLTWSDKACPETVPGCPLWEAEPCYLKSVNHTVVSVSRIVYFKSQNWVRL